MGYAERLAQKRKKYKPVSKTKISQQEDDFLNQYAPLQEDKDEIKKQSDDFLNTYAPVEDPPKPVKVPEPIAGDPDSVSQVLTHETDTTAVIPDSNTTLSDYIKKASPEYITDPDTGEQIPENDTDAIITDIADRLDIDPDESLSNIDTDSLAEAIAWREGFYASDTTRNRRNNNPGNLKYHKQKGATGQDDDGFAIFESEEAGWDALRRQIVLDRERGVNSAKVDEATNKALNGEYNFEEIYNILPDGKIQGLDYSKKLPTIHAIPEEQKSRAEVIDDLQVGIDAISTKIARLATSREVIQSDKYKKLVSRRNALQYDQDRLNELITKYPDQPPVGSAEYWEWAILHEKNMAEVDVKAEDEAFLQKIREQMRSGETPKHWEMEQGHFKNFVNSIGLGTNDLIDLAGGAVHYMGYEDAGEAMREQAEKYRYLHTKKDFIKDFEWSDMADPDFYLTKGTRMIPMLTALIPMAYAGFAGGAALATTWGLGATGITITGGIAGALASRPLESSMEAMGVYNELIDQGYSREDAARGAARTFKWQMTMAGADAFQVGLAFAKVPVPLRNAFLEWGKKAGKFVLGVTSEGYEEVIQEWFNELGKATVEGRVDPEFMNAINPAEWSMHQKEAFVLGTGMGFSMQMAGQLKSEHGDAAYEEFLDTYIQNVAITYLDPKGRHLKYDDSTGEFSWSDAPVKGDEGVFINNANLYIPKNREEEDKIATGPEVYREEMDDGSVKITYANEDGGITERSYSKNHPNIPDPEEGSVIYRADGSIEYGEGATEERVEEIKTQKKEAMDARVNKDVNTQRRQQLQDLTNHDNNIRRVMSKVKAELSELRKQTSDLVEVPERIHTEIKTAEAKLSELGEMLNEIARQKTAIRQEIKVSEKMQKDKKPSKEAQAVEQDAKDQGMDAPEVEDTEVQPDHGVAEVGPELFIPYYDNKSIGEFKTQEEAQAALDAHIEGLPAKSTQKPENVVEETPKVSEDGSVPPTGTPQTETTPEEIQDIQEPKQTELVDAPKPKETEKEFDQRLEYELQEAIKDMDKSRPVTEQGSIMEKVNAIAEKEGIDPNNAEFKKVLKAVSERVKKRDLIETKKTPVKQEVPPESLSTEKFLGDHPEQAMSTGIKILAEESPETIMDSTPEELADRWSTLELGALAEAIGSRTTGSKEHIAKGIIEFTKVKQQLKGETAETLQKKYTKKELQNMYRPLSKKGKKLSFLDTPALAQALIDTRDHQTKETQKRVASVNQSKGIIKAIEEGRWEDIFTDLSMKEKGVELRDNHKGIWNRLPKEVKDALMEGEVPVTKDTVLTMPKDVVSEISDIVTNKLNPLMDPDKNRKADVEGDISSEVDKAFNEVLGPIGESDSYKYNQLMESEKSIKDRAIAKVQAEVDKAFKQSTKKEKKNVKEKEVGTTQDVGPEQEPVDPVRERRSRLEQRPSLVVVGEEHIPTPGENVSSGAYEIGEDQRLGVNLILDRHKGGHAGFGLFDGTGVGKTRQMLVSAYEIAKETGKPAIIITQNMAIIEQGFKSEAEALGLSEALNDGTIEIATYSALTRNKAGQKPEYSVILYDEAHNLKNYKTKKAEAGRLLSKKAPFKVYATATPMDRLMSAIYFFHNITGLSQEAIMDRLGLQLVQDPDFPDDPDKKLMQYTEGHNWASVIEEVVAMRQEAIEAGAMIRREYPFYGIINSKQTNMSPEQQQEHDAIVNSWGGDKRAALQETAVWSEQQKLQYALDRVKQDIKEGFKPIVVVTSVSSTIKYKDPFTGEIVHKTYIEKNYPQYDLRHRIVNGKKVPHTAESIMETYPEIVGRYYKGTAKEMSRILTENGIKHAKIYGDGTPRKVAEVDKFQGDKVDAAVMTPASGGTGINLDDVGSGKPRRMYILTMDYSGDVVEQVTGRISRRKTSTPAYMEIVTIDGSLSDIRRMEIIEKKIGTLRSVQHGKDVDTESLKRLDKNIKGLVEGETNEFTDPPTMEEIFPPEKKKTQAEIVSEEIADEPKSIKEIAEKTGILEPNIRRILGQGAKKGTFERVDKGVYVLKKENGEQVAYIEAGEAQEVLPRMVKEGKKFDMVFLDPAYFSRALVGGNRGIKKYEFITPNEFGNVMGAVNQLVKEDDTHVYVMLSGARTAQKDMLRYVDAVIDNDFKLVGEGSYTKLFKNGKPVTNVRGEVAAPERVLLFSLSGEARKGEVPVELNFRFLRPPIKSSYQTEKPKELLKALIRQSTIKGEEILDPFAGSGVTGEQAIETDRKVTLVEKQENVVEDVTAPRVEQAQSAMDEAVIRSMSNMAGHQGRIQTLINNGATNAEIKELIAYEFGLGGGSGFAAYKGGKNPVVSIRSDDGTIEETLKGKALIDKVRELYSIPDKKDASEVKEKTPEEQIKEDGDKLVKDLDSEQDLENKAEELKNNEGTEDEQIASRQEIKEKLWDELTAIGMNLETQDNNMDRLVDIAIEQGMDQALEYAEELKAQDEELQPVKLTPKQQELADTYPENPELMGDPDWHSKGFKEKRQALIDKVPEKKDNIMRMLHDGSTNPDAVVKSVLEGQQNANNLINEEPKGADDVYNMSPEDLNISTEHFQNRSEDWSQETYDKIMSDGWQPHRQDPVLVWKDENGEVGVAGLYYILSGHSRTQAAKDLRVDTIKVVEFKGTLKEAKHEADLSNELSTSESIVDRIKKVTRMIKEGVPKSQIKAQFEQGQKLIDLSGLDPNGKFMQLLSNRDVQAYRLDSWARAIGVLRSKYPDKMTNAHEDQIFEYLYGEGSTNARLDKNTILIEIEKQLEDMMFTPDKPLLIKGAGEVKTGTRGRSDTAKIQEKLDEAIRKMKEAATTEEMEHWKAKVDKYTKDIQDIIDSQTTLFSFPDPRIIKLWYNLAISTGRFVYKDLPKIVQQQGKKLGITRDNFHQKFRELGRKFSKLSSNLKAWWKKVSKHIKKWMKDNKTQEGHIKPGIVVHEMARRKAMRIVHGLQKGLKQAGKHTDQTLSAAKKNLTGEESLADVDDMDKIMSYIEWLRSERKGTATTPEERETLDKKALLKEQKKRKKYLSDNNLEKGAIKAIRKWGRGKKKTYQFNFTSLEKTIEDLVTNELKKLRRDLRSAKTPEHKAVLKERIELLESHDPGKEFIELKRDQEVYVRTRAFPMTATLEKLWSKVPRKDKLIIRQIIEQGVETVEVPSLDKYGRETTTEIRRPAMEGLHPHTEAFIMWWDKARDQIHRAAVQQGLIEAERKIKDYFPLVLNETVRQTLRKGDPKWADAVNHVLGQLQARGIAAEDRGEPLYWTMKDELGDVVEEISYADLTYEHAEEFLTNFMNRYRNGGVRKNFMEAVFKGSERHYIHSYPLELSRDRILPEWAYEDDATHVLHTYIHSTWETISYAKFFEKQIDEFEYEKTDEIYKQFLNYGFPEEDVKTLIQAAMRLKLPDAYRAKAVRMAKNLSIVLLGPQTTIKNYTDLSKAFAYTDMRSVLFSTIKLMFHPPSRRLAQAMIGSKAVFSQELEEGGISGNFARLWTKAILFTMSERHVRKIQGLSAIHYAEVMLKRYKPNRKIDRFNKQARRRFEMWGVDIDAAKARGRLSRQEKMRIGNLAVMQMQPTSPLDKPLTWETKEHMQKWSIYRSFGFKHLKYVKDYAIKQEFMKNGNPRPMLRFIISAHVMGMGMRMILDFLFPPDEDKQRKSEDAVMQYINAVLASGQLGIVGDMMNSTRFAWYSPSVYNTILGPYYGSVIDGVAKAAQSAYNLAVGKSNPFRPIKKFSSRIFARKIPFIGREVEKEFVGEKKSLSL